MVSIINTVLFWKSNNIHQTDLDSYDGMGAAIVVDRYQKRRLWLAAALPIESTLVESVWFIILLFELLPSFSAS